MSISSAPEIISEIRAGRMVVLVDEEDRENEGDLVLAADFVTPEAINFMATHARGLICLTLTEERCRQLSLPMMVSDNRARMGTAFTVSIEAATGVTTGISAADRARTVRAAVARHAKPTDIVQPGHIFPVMAQNGGVLVRAGHTEAGCDLAERAGLTPAAVICEIMKPDGEMARLPDLLEFSKAHGLKIGTIADLIRHRSETEKLVERVSDKAITTAYGAFRLCVYHDKSADELHYALVKGEPTPDRPVLVRVHEPFMSLDLFDFDSSRHAYSVQDAMRIVAHHREGVIVLLRRREPASEILERLASGPKEVKAPKKWDPRLHGIGAQILKDLGVGQMRVMARPKRIPSMAGFGLEVVEYVSPDDAKGLKAV
ncbi:bifunctional 3,4-dihydroxy-2-butanone-4-phosphate synthase/GTP cyclohydrolase II [Usitatibacter palustris]|uniref:3,4-dihydroxy-2-butanone 4-phosphate synthase n=1 Tax=Usitatibacter palustris TaxID=2732487 RepID=A0A6M4H5Y6_9PROT|nr:bifunctional 3,4-dihydroxy-2-butanone-4-phosphate synthase/GTP cyclohydrolase II [Usitatibacter palustris]QJR14722.1 Riboflavin biosynthesis protein RibBA [Usitatibacter palustris]